MPLAPDDNILIVSTCVNNVCWELIIFSNIPSYHPLYLYILQYCTTHCMMPGAASFHGRPMHLQYHIGADRCITHIISNTTFTTCYGSMRCRLMQATCRSLSSILIMLLQSYYFLELRTYSPFLSYRSKMEEETNVLPSSIFLLQYDNIIRTNEELE